VRGKAWVVNVGQDPVQIEPERIAAAAAGRGRPAPNVVLEAAHATIVQPGQTELARFTGTFDPFTPPGTYKAKITVNGVEEAALLEVSEHVSLSLSDTELVIFGEPGVQHRRMTATNRGNIALPISRLGPVELEYDPPHSLARSLETILERRYAAPPPRDPDEPPPTVEARLQTAVELEPGESGVLDWAITVNGTLQPGIRYRAFAALYTSDVKFVVTPSQDGVNQPARGAHHVRRNPAHGPDRASRASAPGRKRRPS
jgi:hypothetical protein